MTEETRPSGDELPQPVVHRRRFGASLIWLVPAIAALVGLSLVIHNWLQAGPTVTISFQSAEGLDAGKTPVKYKNVVIGKVQKIRLSEDRSQVLVKVALEKSAESFARADTRFWVVRPRIGLGGVSGVDTLAVRRLHRRGRGHLQRAEVRVQGAGAAAGGDLRRARAGASSCMPTTSARWISARRCISAACRWGACRLLQAGQGRQGRGLPDLRRRPLRSFRDPVLALLERQRPGRVARRQRAEGEHAVAGGRAGRWRGVPGSARAARRRRPRKRATATRLFDDKATAMAPPDGPPHYIRMRFEQSLRGLAVDAPVEFLGINIGRVVSINMDYDEKQRDLPGHRRCGDLPAASRSRLRQVRRAGAGAGR